ncbi:MAG: hypothetical protein ACUVRD_05845 [Bacteroidia bacterium]
MRWGMKTLRQMEDLLRKNGYKLHYGIIQAEAGACILHGERRVVASKYLTTEGKIWALGKIIAQERASMSYFPQEAEKLFTELGLWSSFS